MKRGIWLGGLALLLLLLVGCSEVDSITETDLGSGTGGPALSGSEVSLELSKASGEVMGSYAYDGGNLVSIYSSTGLSDPILGAFVDATGLAGNLVITRLLGRPDTACRYQMALLARDEGFELGEVAWRNNSKGVRLYEGNVSKGTDFRRFFCAELNNKVGVNLTLTTDAEDKLSYQIWYHLIDSIKAQ